MSRNLVTDKMGLYVHIPFCSKKCDYCDFISFSMSKEAQVEYLAALFEEIDIMKKKFIDKEFDTLYIGGGTPSFVYEGFIIALARKIWSSFKFSKDTEFTIEINPSSCTEEKLFEYIQAGVNRVSIGVQCLDEHLLKALGRIQSMENIDNTFNLLHKMRFRNVCADIMIGLPNQTMAAVKDTVNYCLKQKVQHISVYTLQVEKSTVLYDKVNRGDLKPLSEEECADMYNMVASMLKKENFLQYEVSNFARSTFESRHNSKYWSGVEYLGLGVSASSFYDRHRLMNTIRLDSYCDRLLNKHELPVASDEYITDSKRRTERIMLSLRTSIGLDLEKFKIDFKEDILQSKKEAINDFIKHNIMKIENGFLIIEQKYFYISNKIILELL